MASRRDLLVAATALAVSGVAYAGYRARLGTKSFHINRTGGYRAVLSGAEFGRGVEALPGYEIIVIKPDGIVALEDAWAFIGTQLSELKLTSKALCAMELRVPLQLTCDDYRTFNAGFAANAALMGLAHGDRTIIARTTIARFSEAQSGPSLHAFAFAMPSTFQGKTFYMSGTSDNLSCGRSVYPGDTTPSGLRAKLDFAVVAMRKRLAVFGLDLSDATDVEIFSDHPIANVRDALPSNVEFRLREGKPVVMGLEVEVGCWSVRPSPS